MSRSQRLSVALGVNLALVVALAIAARLAHSTSLLAAAGHNLSDVCAVALSLAAVRWATRPRSSTRSFGNHRGTILAALANAAALFAVTAVIVVLSIDRLVHPVAVRGGILVVMALVAMGANAACAMVVRDGTHDLNMRSVFLHMTADVLSAAFVLVAGLILLVSGGSYWERIDPIASLEVSALILVEAYRILRGAIDVLLESTPADLDLNELRLAIMSVEGVSDVHDVHAWSLASEVRALSAHLVLAGHPTLEEAQEVGGAVRSRVSAPFELSHTTFELECERCDDDLADPCGMDEVVEEHGQGANRARTRRNPE